MTIMLPILVAFFDILSIFGSYLISVNVMGINPVQFITSVNDMGEFSDLAGGLLKSAVFGLVTALIACRQGLSTSGGALGVGQATTRSVVFSLLSIFILNYFMSALMY
jgi:phospholipid/cholesterol/gamma-HCH transport system permease protein